MSRQLARVLLATVSALAPITAHAQTMRTYTATRPVQVAQPPLRAEVDFGSGRLVLRAGGEDRLYSMQVRYDADRYAPMQRYDRRTGILQLGLESVGRSGIRVTSREHLDQVARIEFAPSVPLLLTANLGASEAALDLGGLMLQELEVLSGATRATVEFSRPTTGRCRSATFGVGAGELIVLQLANSGCVDVTVDGGVGRAVLDFSGTWRSDVQVLAKLAMGSMTLRIPRGTGVRLSAERFLASVSTEGLDRTDEGWQTPGYAQAARRITVELKASVAGVNIQWID